MKLKITVLAIFLNLVTIYANDGQDKNRKSKGNEEKVFISNSSAGSTSITWTDKRIEAIEILSSTGQIMPEIPVLDATSIHLTSLENGTYTIKFKYDNETIYEKVIEVRR